MDDRLRDMVFNYLKRNFPIKRLKNDEGKGFKRGIVVADAFGRRKLFFRPQSSLNALYQILHHDVEYVFGITPTETTMILHQYLYAEKYY